VVNIFHGDDETERINVRFVETNHSSGIGKRMSMIFFGNSNIGKDQ
jgi:hypothetical protein